MKKLILIAFMFCFSAGAFADEYNQKLQALMQTPVNCKVKFPDSQTDPVTLLYWDGDCKNGYVDGPGMMVYKRQSNNYPGRYIGHFEEGNLEKNTIWMLTIMTNEGKSNDFVAKIHRNNTGLYGTWGSNPFFSGLNTSKAWVRNTNDMAEPGSEVYTQLSYQEVLKELENDFKRLKPTMSFNKFKSYLEGTWNDGWSGPKLSTASSTNLQDDPPVAGITLTLGDDAKPAKKSKKKR